MGYYPFGTITEEIDNADKLIAIKGTDKKGNVVSIINSTDEPNETDITNELTDSSEVNNDSKRNFITRNIIIVAITLIVAVIGIVNYNEKE